MRKRRPTIFKRLGFIAALFVLLAPLALQAASLERSISIADNAIGLSGAEAAGKGITSVDDLLTNAGKLERLKGGVQQGFVKGDVTTIYQNMTKGAEQLKSGAYKLPNGTILNSHTSTTTGISTIDINQAGQIFKIRIEP